MPFIAIIADIAFKNPKPHSVCSAILSKLMIFLEDDESRERILETIKKRFEETPNSGHALIWIKRITYPFSRDMQFSETVCKIVSGEERCLWNCDWVSEKLKEDILNSEIIDKKDLASMGAVIPGSEIELFNSTIY